MQVNYRELAAEDAKAFIELNISLARETEYMLLTPSEAALTILDQEQRIKDYSAAHDRVAYVAVNGGSLVGFVGATRGNFERNRHCCTLALGVLREYWRQGVATELMRCLYAWAREHRVTRLELSVMQHNQAAVDFYQAMGFLIEGRRRQAIHLQHQFFDEYSMARLLPAADG